MSVNTTLNRIYIHSNNFRRQKNVFQVIRKVLFFKSLKKYKLYITEKDPEKGYEKKTYWIFRLIIYLEK